MSEWIGDARMRYGVENDRYKSIVKRCHSLCRRLATACQEYPLDFILTIRLLVQCNAQTMKPRVYRMKKSNATL